MKAANHHELSSTSTDPSTSSSESGELLDLQADDGWEDAEPDEEITTIVSLFDEATFPDVKSMVEYTRQRFDFDLPGIQKKLGLDFYETIKLVNYVRFEVNAGNKTLDISTKTAFADDMYLKPVLADDALLFGLDDLEALQTENLGGANGSHKGKALQGDRAADAFARVAELEEQIRKMQSEFSQYRLVVAKTLEERWDDPDTGVGSSARGTEDAKPAKDDDSHYFESYAYNDIHEIMLKDTVRTNSYRDFIYTHKHLFSDKVVLDIGAGTGILSLFCARAGARHVIAVDNSSIIDKCTANVFENGLQDKITCLHGKIEEVIFPLGIEKVDIIVSEWMGYCLLYEAMLDSVLWARDRYLKPGGLMVPSHVTVRMAAVADPDYIAESISFWYDVYGFKMSAMMAKIYDDVLIRNLALENLASAGTEVVRFNLHTVNVADLTFKRSFQMELNKDIDALDGWALWFDTFFLPDRFADLPTGAVAEKWRGDAVAFTTGPGGTETHWRSGVLLVDRSKKKATELKKGQKVAGTVAYRKAELNQRELDIEIDWDADGAKESGRQTWFMR